MRGGRSAPRARLTFADALTGPGAASGHDCPRLSLGTCPLRKTDSSQGWRTGSEAEKTCQDAGVFSLSDITICNDSDSENSRETVGILTLGKNLARYLFFTRKDT